MGRDQAVRVLALGHDASNTGAPRLLLDLLRWARENARATNSIWLRRGGPLVAPMRTVGSVRALRPWGRRTPTDIIEVGLGEIGASAAASALPAVEGRVRSLFDRSRPDLVIVNGMGAAALLAAVPSDLPVAVLVHELGVGMERAAAAPLRQQLWARAERVVAVSEAVAACVREEAGLDPSAVTVAHGFVDPAPSDRYRAEATARRRRSLGLPDPDRPLIGAVGTGDWRKGIDLFVQLAAVLRQRGASIPRMAWVGAVRDLDRVRHDVERAELTDQVLLVGEVNDARPWYPAFDVMVSTAREDPFPLVGLEAGVAARPVVSFDNGGLRELLAGGCGALVPRLDVAAMADRVSELLTARNKAELIGERLRCRVLADHVTAVGAPRLWDALTASARG